MPPKAYVFHFHVIEANAKATHAVTGRNVRTPPGRAACDTRANWPTGQKKADSKDEKEIKGKWSGSTCLSVN